MRAMQERMAAGGPNHPSALGGFGGGDPADIERLLMQMGMGGGAGDGNDDGHDDDAGRNMIRWNCHCDDGMIEGLSSASPLFYPRRQRWR